MNFLAHFQLTPPYPDPLAGAYLGDFIRGHLTDHPDLPPAVRQGVDLHRQIDGYTDRHPVWRRSAERLAPRHRRLAGIAIDIIYDHFLSRHWSRFSSTGLEEFSALCYTSLLSRTQLMPPHARRAVRRMSDQDWLSTYAEIDGIALAFHRLTYRSPVLATLPAVMEDFQSAYRGLERDFLEYYPCVRAFAKEAWLSLDS